MLKRFEVQNFKNFKDKFVFDLSETKNYEFNPECVRDGLVSKALIYGPNGCGKSNLGLAIFDLVLHLTDKRSEPHLYQNYLNADSENLVGKYAVPKPEAHFTYVFQFGGVSLEYSYEKVELGFVVLESLKLNQQEVLSYRIGEPIQTNLQGTETLNKDLGGSSLSALKYLRNNAVLTDEISRNVLDKFFKFVDGMLFFRSVENNVFIGYENVVENMDGYIAKNSLTDDFERFLNNAGIKCKLAAVSQNGEQRLAFVFEHSLREFWEMASTGTKSLTLYYYWMQKAKAIGERNALSFVFIDEFDAFYHHTLSQLVISELKKLPVQAVLTTHNTSIMTNDLLRPDCYFIMQDEQIAPIYKFTDKELRFAHNIENMYRRGAFNG